MYDTCKINSMYPFNSQLTLGDVSVITTQTSMEVNIIFETKRNVSCNWTKL